MTIVPLQRRGSARAARSARSLPATGSPSWAVRTLALAVVVAALVGAAATLVPATTLDVDLLATRTAQTGLAAAGLLLLVVARWRPGGPHTWTGAALLVLSGAGGVVQGLWDVALPTGHAHAVLVPAAVLGLLMAVRPTSDHRRTTVLVTLAPLVLTGTLLAVHLGGAHGRVEVLLCAGALAATAVAVGRSPRWEREDAAVLALTLGVLAAVLGLRALPDEPAAATAAQAGLLVAAAALLLGTVAHLAVRAAHDTHSRVDGLVVDLADHERAVSRMREHVHDARSTLAGIRASQAALDRPGDRTDGPARTQIRTAIHSEMTRLERLLTHQETAEPVELELDDVVETVLVGLRERGLRVLFTPTSARVTACRDTVAEVLTNLLDNCLRHAPGATARITVDTTTDMVLLSVIDDGPGIDPALRDSVFDAGVRGRRGRPGEGLGLASARRLAREQGGDVRLVDGNGGCWFVLRLPVALRPVPDPAGAEPG